MWAWAKLGNLVEKMFDEMSKEYKMLPQKCYNCVLCIYVEKKMLDKANGVVKQMSDEGIRILPQTLDTIVRLYVEEGDVAKADSMLQNWVCKKDNMQPLYFTYLCLLEAYAKRGDYHNAEKVFYLTRQMGYSARLKMYKLLLCAYVNAKVPAYGFRDRLRADNIFPKKILRKQLLAVDPFKKAPVTEVFE